MNGYHFTIAPNTMAKRIEQPTQTHNDFVGFTMAMEQYRKQWHDGKNAPGHVLWAPCRFDDCPENGYPRAMSSLAQPTRLIGLDFDDDTNTIDGVQRALDALGCDFYIYTTMSYVGGTTEKCRAVLHGDKMLNADEYKMVYDELKTYFKINDIIIDRACSNISRKFYVPGNNKKTGYECFMTGEWERGPLNVSTLLIGAKRRQICAKIHADGERSMLAERMAGRTVNHATPFYHGPYDHNIADTARVAAFMASSSRGAEMASMCAHMVGFCKTKFGPDVVSEHMMIDAITDWAGKTTHNNFTQNIQDAIKKYG